MPCEACNVQFTVFKRKKSCSECRRLYCNNCLTKNKERNLCKRCIIFTARPLSKIELLKLKAKDLIYYLQSKHISTTGCVEKEELVNLVLIHVDSSSYTPDSQSSTFPPGGQFDDNRSNPFDQIKNTCQNLFTTFAEKISADLNFDLKPAQSDRQPNVCENQPRYGNNFRYQAPYSGSSPSGYSGSNNQSYNQRPTTNNSEPTTDHSPNNGATNSNSSSRGATSPVNSIFQSSTTTSSGSSSPSVFQTAASPLNRANRSNEIGDSNTQRSCLLHNASAPNRNISEARPERLSDKNSDYNSRLHHRSRQASRNNGHLAHFNKFINDSSGSGCVGSGCECSDDEIITKFQKKYKKNSISKSSDGEIRIKNEIEQEIAGPSGSRSSSTKTEISLDTPIKDDCTVIESSDISSFEDLGAAGVCCAASDTDNWQIVNKPSQINETPSTSSASMDAKQTSNNSLTMSQFNKMENNSHQRYANNSVKKNNETFHTHSTNQIDAIGHLEKTIKFKNSNRKIVRRRSDGIVYIATSHNNPVRNFGFDDDADEDDDDKNHSSSSTSEEMTRKRTKKSCRKCGKTKGDLKKYIARFRRQLQTTNSSEAEIKQQLDAFLKFLEKRNSSDERRDDEDDVPVPLDYSPDDLMGSSNDDRDTIRINDIIVNDYDDNDDENFDEDAGIHVYGTNDDAASNQAQRQFFNLNNIGSREQLDDLSVKQLKEVLMLNRVDFKGCCEKSELLERVQRLWNDQQNCPAIDKLQTDDLCKICMDAAIECVLLECGHMATCTNCGKVLSECPICRQYIVRVVRFFKA